MRRRAVRQDGLGDRHRGDLRGSRSRDLGANIDVYTIMPFDFGCSSGIYNCTVSAANGLRDKLKGTFGWSDATGYAHMGISGMNGLSDQQELTDPGTWTQIRDWANGNHIARLAFWSVNRDRPCPGGGVVAGRPRDRCRRAHGCVASHDPRRRLRHKVNLVCSLDGDDVCQDPDGVAPQGVSSWQPSAAYAILRTRAPTLNG
jgi:hypothetical protein